MELKNANQCVFHKVLKYPSQKTPLGILISRPPIEINYFILFTLKETFAYSFPNCKLIHATFNAFFVSRPFILTCRLVPRFADDICHFSVEELDFSIEIYNKDGCTRLLMKAAGYIAI